MRADDLADAMMRDAAPQSQPPKNRPRRFDAISFVAGLLFIAIGLLAMADSIWVDIDPVLIVGGSVVAVGMALIINVIGHQIRQRHVRQVRTTPPRKERE
ncbi:hypothetical protein [Candidatus Poriferisodalis sp.]|uniref:hypothetical protein n=1 Tax=Candidatus Poriferisodalis sp. TaxID=3101277 RepID=UPI003C7036A5